MKSGPRSNSYFEIKIIYGPRNKHCFKNDIEFIPTTDLLIFCKMCNLTTKIGDGLRAKTSLINADQRIFTPPTHLTNPMAVCRND